MRVTVLLAVLCLLLACATSVLGAPLPWSTGMNDFEGYDVDVYLSTSTSAPEPKDGTAWSDNAGQFTLDPARYLKVEIDPDNPGNKVAHIYDADTANAKLVQAVHDFYENKGGTTEPDVPFPSTGVYSITMDVKPLQDSGPLQIRITDGYTPTSGPHYVCSLGFGSTLSNAYFPGIATAGARLFTHVVTTGTSQWAETGKSYTANTWYTLKFLIDIDLKKFQVYMGPRGGTLTEVTGGPTPWIVAGATGLSATCLGGMIVATSGNVGDATELLLDNVIAQQEPVDRSNWIAWDTVYRADTDWPPGVTEDPNHYTWQHGFQCGEVIRSHEFTCPAFDGGSDGLYLDNYQPANVDVSWTVKSLPNPNTPDNQVAICYRGQPNPSLYPPNHDFERGTPAFAYRLSWPQDGTSISLGYWWWSALSNVTYTPATPIDWTIYHVVRVRAIGLHHQVWLDGNKIIDWTDTDHVNAAGNYWPGKMVHATDAGDVFIWRNHAELHMDDFILRDVSVQVSSVAAAKAQGVGTLVGLSGADMHVTGAYDGFFYLEDDNKAVGIRVVSSETVAVGNGVALAGQIASADGEMYINATSVTPDTAEVKIGPLGMNNKAHGGDAELSNIGLLSRIWGKVTYLSPDWTYFYVDDGAGVSDGSGKTGIKVYNYDGWIIPGEQDYVAVTGVASMDPGGIPVIRMRLSLDDLSIVYDAP